MRRGTPESLDPNKQTTQGKGREPMQEVGVAARTGGVVVEARGEGVEAPADGEEEIRRDGDAGDEVLVYQRLVLQLLVLRRREGRRPGRPPRAHRVLLLLRRRLLPDDDPAAHERKHTIR